MEHDVIETEHPDLSLVDDLRPNAAWDYAHRRRPTEYVGWGVKCRGQWLAALDDFGPRYTTFPAEAQCFAADAGAKRLGLLLIRHNAQQEIQEPVFIHRIPKVGQ